MGEHLFLKRPASSFDLWVSLFEDDKRYLLFKSRADIKLGASYHFDYSVPASLRLMYVGIGTALFETEVIYLNTSLGLLYSRHVPL
jgi:hypothetical protein